jgi:hypothetical protein
MMNDDDDPVTTASLLRAEAVALLDGTHLLETLRTYGEVHVTGSCSYDLMTWRDIDLCVGTQMLNIETIFRLGLALASLPHVGSMYYRNEFIMNTPGNPRAVFWCTDFYLPDSQRWKVDILLAEPEEVERILGYGRQLMQRLTGPARAIILEIKNVVCRRPGYRQEFGSREIYDAVLDHNVVTLEDWDAWRERQDDPQIENSAR